MSTAVSYIIHRASEMVGLKDFDSDTMDDDALRKVFFILCDTIRNINQQDSIAFSTVTVTKQVNGNAVTFQPYTDSELEIISGGGTVDTTNRIVDIRPTICPSLYSGSDQLYFVDPMDLPIYKDSHVCSWNPDWDKDVINFGDTFNGELVCQIRKPIPVPTVPSQYIEVPEKMNEYIICHLAYNIASILGMSETLPIVKANMESAKKIVVNNTRDSRPVYMDTRYRFY